MNAEANDSMQSLMREATRLTRAGRLNEATSVLQQALGAAQAAGRPMPAAALPALSRPPVTPPSAGVPATPPGSFTRGTHSHGGLSRDFKLFVPPGAHAHPLPLVVMLHGCKQDPDDFATGTAMNRRAAEQGFIVLYPAQAQGSNPAACWNWFKPEHQQRGRGEPALIANLTQAVAKTHDADRRRIYAAGLSAGGAMAAVLARAYPDLFAAVGVHSGLPCDSAHDVMSALAVMKSGVATERPLGRACTMPTAEAPRPVPTIVFHGDRDATVHPRNGEQLVARLLHADAGTSPTIELGVCAQGRRFTRTVHRDAQGVARAEHWQVHGAGHAWSGGDPGGSFADPSGPDATLEMLRFFSQHLNLGG